MTKGLTELREPTRTRPGGALTREELSVVTANLKFALANCPIDGGVLTEDGSASSEESVRVLLAKLEATMAHPISLKDLADGDVKLLKAIAEYAVKECPIDGAMMLDSGRFISKADLRALKERIVALQQEAVPKLPSSGAVELLEKEHRLILRMVKLLPAVRRGVEAGEVDLRVILDIADFFSSFTDGCHHAKEEDLLFPLLQQRGVSSKGCPVGTLKLEHQQGRSLVGALKSAVEKYRGGDMEAVGAITSVLKEANELYTAHIWREDYLLFPMSGKVLSDSDREALARDFDGVQARFGPAFLERHESLVKRLEASIGQVSATPQAPGLRASSVSS